MRFPDFGDHGKDVQVPAFFAFHDLPPYQMRGSTAPRRVAILEPSLSPFNEPDKRAASRVMFRSPAPPRRAVLLRERRARCARGGRCGPCLPASNDPGSPAARCRFAPLGISTE